MQRTLSCCAILFAAVLTLSGCGQEKKTAAPRQPLPVTTVTVQSKDEVHWLETIGQAEAGAAINVTPQAGGRILRVNYKEGDFVEAGQVLFEIDPSSLAAQLASAEAARRQLEDELRQADREYRRNAELLKSGAGSQKDFDDAKSLRSQKQSALAQAKANEEDARINLSWTQVRAPVQGFVSKALFNPGAIVIKDSSVLASITQKDDIRVLFAPSDRDLAGADITNETRVRVFRTDGKEVPASLDYIAQTYGADTGTRTLRVKVPSDAGLLPGEFVRIRYQTTVDRNAWRVPQRAVKQLPDGTYALFVLKDGKAIQTAVEVGLWEGRDWIIRKGLADGEKVIIDQLIKLQNGTPVTERAPGAQAAKAKN